MSLLPNSGASIFTTMTKLANEHNAINLAQGFPNFPSDERLTDCIAKAAKGNLHQYMPSTGYPPLVENIGKLVKKSYDRSVSANEILVTAGATQGIFTAIQALVRPDDEVIILDPAYDCYDAPIILCGADPIHVQLSDDFSPDWNAVAEKMNAKTRMIIINNPHNPSGKIWVENDFIGLENLLEKYPDVILLSDEVYEFITFDKPHLSVNMREKLKTRSIVVSSFGKSFHITGWKIGYVIAPENLMSEIRNVHQYLVFSVNSLAQVAIAEYLSIADISLISSFYKIKRDQFLALIGQSRFDLLPCEGSYFQIASYANISAESDLDFTKRLVTACGVAAIPLSVFNKNGTDNRLIRFCFAKNDATLKAAAERLNKL